MHGWRHIVKKCDLLLFIKIVSNNHCARNILWWPNPCICTLSTNTHGLMVLGQQSACSIPVIKSALGLLPLYKYERKDKRRFHQYFMLLCQSVLRATLLSTSGEEERSWVALGTRLFLCNLSRLCSNTSVCHVILGKCNPYQGNQRSSPRTQDLKNNCPWSRNSFRCHAQTAAPSKRGLGW